MRPSPATPARRHRSVPVGITPWREPGEGGWLLVLSVLLIAATVWLVRRRAA